MDGASDSERPAACSAIDTESNPDGCDTRNASYELSVHVTVICPRDIHISYSFLLLKHVETDALKLIKPQ